MLYAVPCPVLNIIYSLFACQSLADLYDNDVVGEERGAVSKIVKIAKGE